MAENNPLLEIDGLGSPKEESNPLLQIDGLGETVPDVKKKEQTEPTQAAQTQQQAPTQAAPLLGLGGVSEEPTPSPSVGQLDIRTGTGALASIEPTPERKALSDYEKNQKALSDIDKQIASIGSSATAVGATGMPMMRRDVSSDELKSQRDRIRSKSDSLIPEARKITDEIVSSEISDGKYREFLTEDGTAVDPTKVGDLAREKALEYGLPDDGYFFDLVRNSIESNVESNRIKERVDKNFNDIMQEKHGMGVDDYVKSVVEKSADATGITKLVGERDLAIANVYDNISTLAKNEVEKIQVDRYGKTAEEYASDIRRQYESQISAVNERYSGLMVDGKFTGNQQQFEAYKSDFESISNAAQEQIDQIVSQEIKDVAAVNAKYDLRYKRQADEIARMYADKIDEKAKLVDPIIKKEIESAYKSAVGKVYEDENKGKKASEFYNAYSSFGPGAAIASFVAKPFTKSILDQTSTYLRAAGLQELSETAKLYAKSVDIGEFKLDNADDFLDPLNVLGATGQTIGGMVPTLVPSVAVGFATGGIGWLPTLAAGATGFAVESVGIAQDAYDDRFAATGSVSEAEEARDKAWKAQTLILPAYALDNFPIFGKIAGGTAKRIALGALGEYGTELLQEYPQNVFEEVIRNDENLSEAMKYVSFDGFKKTASNLTPVLLIGAGGQARQISAENNIKNAAATLSAKMNIGNMTDSSLEQYMLYLTASKGSDFALAFVDAQLRTGNIAEDVAEKSTNAINNSKSFIDKTRNLKISNESKLALASFDLKIRNAKESIESETDPMLKSVEETKLKQLEKQAGELATTGTTDYVVVAFKNNTFEILTPQELEVMSNNENFISSFSNGDIKVEMFGKNQKQMSDMLNEKVKQEPVAEATPAETTEAVESVKDEEAKDLSQNISDYISELVTKARTRLNIGGTIDKVNNAEYINENEINSAIDDIFKEIDRVSNSTDISEKAKETIISSLYETAEQLDNYEFTTETRTKTVTQSRTTKNLGAFAEKVSVEGFFKDAAGTIDGEENVRFTTDKGVVKAKRADGTEFILDTPSMRIDDGDIVFDENGILESVTVTDNSGARVTFTGETAMDLAIRQRMNEIGSVPDAALQQIITEEVQVEEEVLKQPKTKEDAIQEQAAGKVPVQPEAKAGKEVEKGKPETEPEKPTEKGKEEVSEEEKVKAAKDNLNNVWEKWKQSQKNLGVVFDPKSKANEDMELLEAFLTYIKALGVKTAKDIQKAFNDFTGGEATLDDAGAEFVSESVKEPVVKKPVSIASETTGLTLRNQFTQGFREYTDAIKKLNKEKIDKIKNLSKEKLKELRESENKKRIAQRQKLEEAVDNVKTKLKEAIKNAKDDAEARKIFNDFISTEMKELEISELSRGKIKRLLGMSKNASKDSFDAIVDKGISILVSQAKRNLNLDIKSAKGKLKDLINKGRFGTSTQTAKLLNSIPTDAIPVQYLKDYLDILEVLTSTAKPSAAQLNRLNEFMNSISQEIDSYINDMEFYAGEYNEYLEASKDEKQSKDYLDAKAKKAKDRTEAEKILIERVGAKRKEGFKERLSELGATEDMIIFVENNFDRITSTASKMNKKDGVELTNKEKIAIENAKRKDAIALLNAMFPVEKGKRNIKNIGRFSGNKLALDIANFFNGIVPKDLKDLSAKQIESIVDIMENIENGMITPAMFDMMTTINATRDVEKISGAASGIVRAVDNAVESFYAIRNLIERDITEKQEIVKNVQKKIDEALSLQSQEIGSIIKGMKGSAFYEIISSVTSAMSVATSQINKMKERTYFLFYNMKGSPVENTILISLYHRAREFEMLEGNEDPTILDPIEYLDRAILDEGNSYRKDILIDIRKKFLSNGTISSKDVLNEIEKRKGGELVKFMDETNLANRDKARSIAEIIRGIVFKEVDGYGASRAAEDGKADNLQDRVNRINNGSIVGSAKAGSINKRTVNTAKTFDAVSDFINQNADLIYEYELAEPLSTISKTTSIMKATGNADMRSLGKVIHGYISELLSDSFSMSMQDSGYWTSTLRSMTERMKSQMIFSLFVKPISETVAQLPKLLNPDSLTSFGALREATKGSKLSLSQKYDVLLKIGSTSAERAGGMSAESFYRPSYAQRRLMKSASKMEMAFLKAHLPIDKLRRLIEKLNNSRQRVPDRYGPVDIVIGRFAHEFKKITGEYPNFTRIINDGVYLSENKDAIQTARAKADQINNRLFAPSTPQETPKKGYTIPSLKLMPISRAVSSVWRYMWLLDTYSTTEQKTFLRGIKEMRDSLAESIKKDNYNSWSGIEDPSFMRGFAYSSSNVFSMIVYQTSRAVLFGLLETMIAYLTGDDEERESILDSFSSGFESGVRDVVILMPLARTPLPLKMPIFLAVRQLFESKYGKEMADKYMPSFMSVDPGGKIQREAAKMGPMGQGIASIMTAYTTSEKITNDILNTERGWKMSDVLMIGKTIGSLMLGADAQETKRIFGKWASSSRVKDSISASLYGDYDTESVLSDEIFSLYNELDKDKSIIPRDVSDSKKIKGVTYEINDQVIIDEMNAIRGKYIEQAFDNARRDYNKESDPNKKAEMLKEIYRKVNQNKKYEADILKMFAKHGEAVE